MLFENNDQMDCICSAQKAAGKYDSKEFGVVKITHNRRNNETWTARGAVKVKERSE